VSPSYYQMYKEGVDQEVDSLVQEILQEEELALERYHQPGEVVTDDSWVPLEAITISGRWSCSISSSGG
jgi:hypothetical protein